MKPTLTHGLEDTTEITDMIINAKSRNDYRGLLDLDIISAREFHEINDSLMAKDQFRLHQERVKHYVDKFRKRQKRRGAPAEQIKERSSEFKRSLEDLDIIKKDIDYHRRVVVHFEMSLFERLLTEEQQSDASRIMGCANNSNKPHLSVQVLTSYQNRLSDISYEEVEKTVADFIRNLVCESYLTEGCMPNCPLKYESQNFYDCKQVHDTALSVLEKYSTPEKARVSLERIFSRLK